MCDVEVVETLFQLWLSCDKKHNMASSVRFQMSERLSKSRKSRPPEHSHDQYNKTIRTSLAKCVCWYRTRDEKSHHTNSWWGMNKDLIPFIETAKHNVVKCFLHLITRKILFRYYSTFIIQYRQEIPFGQSDYISIYRKYTIYITPTCSSLTFKVLYPSQSPPGELHIRHVHCVVALF